MGGNKKSILLYIIILFGFLILGGFYYLDRAHERKMLIEYETEIRKQEEEEERAKELQEDAEAFQRGLDYNKCVSNAWEMYSNYWWTECKAVGWELDYGEETCMLPTSNADRVTDTKDKELDRCVELYK